MARGSWTQTTAVSATDVLRLLSDALKKSGCTVGSNLVLSDDSTESQGWIKPTPPTMHQKEWSEVNPPTPLRKTGESFQTFQLGIGGSCGNDAMNGGVGFTPPAGYWCGNGCMGGAPKPPGCISRWPRGLHL